MNELMHRPFPYLQRNIFHYHKKDYLDSALKAALQIHKYTNGGDVLIFLPGQDDIENLISLLKNRLEELDSDDSPEKSRDIVQNIKGIGASINSGSTMIVNGVLICALYAALPPDAQMNAFLPKPDGCVRKIILSTNIAGECVLNISSSTHFLAWISLQIRM